jgi:hypothetical protein
MIPDVRAGERGVGNIPMSLAVRVDENPDAIFLKGMTAEDLRAWICGDCGYTEFYVQDPQRLYLAHSKSRQGDPQT